MKELTRSTAGVEEHGKTTRRAAFLAEMERVLPWNELEALVDPVYPKAGYGYPPVGLECMVRIYLVQQWFHLSDLAVTDALHESVSMCTFVGVGLGHAPAPNGITVYKFRRLLEIHGLGRRLIEEVGRHLQRQGLKVGTGMIVDATIVEASGSATDQADTRDTEKYQTSQVTISSISALGRMADWTQN